ncbi:MAG: hypothetical protein H7834_06845 [Magnetococcus sp. YQC-9]
MRFCFIVEGRQTEKKVYTAWTRLTFPGYQKRDNLLDLQGDDFFIQVGKGYPCLLTLLPDTIGILKEHPVVDHLFVCVDAEEEALAERRARIEQQLAEMKCPCPFSVIIANRCIESWFLGHRKMMTHQPDGNSALYPFWQHYDVRSRDPEAMPKKETFHGTTALYHLKYLQEMFRAKKLNYTKEFPGETQEEHYFTALVERQRDTPHLASFGHLIATWRNLGSPRLNST